MEEEDLESIFWMALAMTAIHMVLRSSILWPGCCCCLLDRKKSGNLPITPIKCIAMSVQSNLCKIPFFHRNPDERTRGMKALFWREGRFGGTDICSDWTLRVLIESQLQNFVFYKTQEGLPYFPKMSIFVLMRYELNSLELIWVPESLWRPDISKRICLVLSKYLIFWWFLNPGPRTSVDECRMYGNQNIRTHCCHHLYYHHHYHRKNHLLINVIYGSQSTETPQQSSFLSASLRCAVLSSSSPSSLLSSSLLCAVLVEVMTVALHLNRGLMILVYPDPTTCTIA